MEIIEKFNPAQYIQLIEKSQILAVQQYIVKEKEFLYNKLINRKRDIIDLGAGYGRISELLHEIGEKKIYIELNQLMFEELKRRTQNDRKTTSLLADITKLDKVDLTQADNPVFLLCQNTIGVVEGEWTKVFETAKKTFVNKEREFIISFLKKTALRTEGLLIYESLSGMIGKPNLWETDFEKGLFFAEGGYKAKWWSDEEIEKIKIRLNAVEKDRLEGDIFTIIHLNF